MDTVLLDKRDEIFAANIISVYDEMKTRELPFVVSLGCAHFKGVSKRLLGAGIEHSYVNMDEIGSNIGLGWTLGINPTKSQVLKQYFLDLPVD